MLKRILLMAACVISALGGGIYFLNTADNEDISVKIQTCDSLLQAYEELGKFNGSVLVAKDGEVILRNGYGIRNDALDMQHEADSIFRIYSITKPFTSTVILRLAEQGKLSVQDHLSKYYPDLPNADAITIAHLLSHTSGLYEFTRENNFVNTEAGLLELLKNRPVDFPPGEGWSYCNSGYCLLGHIIAKVNNSSYEEAVAKHIFEPLGMVDSGFRFNSLDDPRKAIGYSTFSDEERIEVTMEDEGGPFAAGAIYSTVDDLWLFQQALNEGKLLSKASLQKAWTGCPQESDYGFGWQLGSRWFMRQVISHSGGASGFRSNLSQVQSSKYCVVLLNNHENANVEFLTDRIYDILDGRDVEIPKEETKLTAEELEAFVGFYQPDQMQDIIRTYIVDGRLAVDFLGRVQGTMLAQGEDRFYQIESGVSVEFQRDKNGDCIGLFAQQDRMTLEARKYDGAWGIPDYAKQRLTDYVASVEPESDDWHEAAFKLAHLLAFEDEHDEYDQLCQRILENHGDTDSPQIAERTAKACLVSKRGSLVEDVGKLVDKAYAEKEEAGTFDWGGRVHWRDYLAVAKGMADYRRGDVKSAISALEPATTFSRYDDHSACVRDLLLAMAYQVTGDPELATERMEAANAVIERLPASYAEGAWNDRILVELLQNEAKELLPNPVEN